MHSIEAVSFCFSCYSVLGITKNCPPPLCRYGGMVDAVDLGSIVTRRAGSSPVTGTNFICGFRIRGKTAAIESRRCGFDPHNRQLIVFGSLPTSTRQSTKIINR